MNVNFTASFPNAVKTFVSYPEAVFRTHFGTEGGTLLVADDEVVFLFFFMFLNSFIMFVMSLRYAERGFCDAVSI